MEEREYGSVLSHFIVTETFTQSLIYIAKVFLLGLTENIQCSAILQRATD
jgi:hypothetical protein